MAANRTSSSRLPTKYPFQLPNKVHIYVRHSDEDDWIDTSTPIWKHAYYGKMDWNRLNIDPYLKRVIQHYVFVKLESASPRSAFTAFQLALKHQTLLRKRFPYTMTSFLSILSGLRVYEHFTTIRSIYRWAVKKALPGFDGGILAAAERLAPPSKTKRVDSRSSQRYLTDEEERQLIQVFEQLPDQHNSTLRDSVLTQLTWELGLRPVQTSIIEEKHLHQVTSSSGSYFELDIVRVKKGLAKPTFKRRHISESLFNKILLLAAQNRSRYTNLPPDAPLFITYAPGRRGAWKTTMFGKRINHNLAAGRIGSFLRHVGLPRGKSACTLRHNMAQRLADSGFSGPVLTEILDHANESTIQVYIQARSTLGEVKARALGKNATYRKVLDWLLGKQPILRSELDDPARLIHGIVADRYIGNIGACDLPKTTQCPFNPVYACYGCKDFTPFIDGEHNLVANEMAKESLHLVERLGEDGKRLALQNEFPTTVARAVQELCDQTKGKGKLEHRKS